MDGLHTIVVPLLSGAIGALIGTFGGVYLSFIRQEKTKKESRKMAIKAIEILKKYSKKNGTFDQAEQEFNNSVSLSEKRTILVALHKLGIPIIIQPDACFAIDSVCFDKVRIDRDELTAIGNQIEKGQCDHLFFIDPDTYFNDSIRIATLRSVAKRWVTEVLCDSTCKDSIVYYPDDWFLKYSWGEKLALGVFKQRVSVNEFFDAGGTIIKEKVNQLLREIDRGLWDNSLFWDIEAYQSLQSTYSLNSQISKIIQSNNVAIGSDRSTKSEESSSFES